MVTRASQNSRRGLALPSAMFTLVALSVLATGLFTFADLGAKSVRNRESATRAQHVAEAGVNHALGLLRGSLRSRSFSQILRGADGAPNTVDDSVFINWPGLAPADQIPYPAGQAYQGHTYVVTIADDPADTDPNADMNGRVRIWCRAVTADGATAVIEGVVGAVPMPGIAADGNLSIGNNNTISGECGGVHANGNLSTVGGGPTISGQATATGTVSGSYTLPNGTPAPQVNGAPEVVIPDLNPMNFCPDADFRLFSNGTATTGAGMPIFPGPLPAGWTWDNPTQTWRAQGTPTAPPAGTYCVQGNAWVAGNTGSAAAPKAISVLATGSIRVDGIPYIIPDHPDGILLMAGGDVSLTGNPAAGATSFQGMVYAGAQCLAQGTATMFGQLLCANGAQPAGATQYAGPGSPVPAGSSVAGSFRLTFDCSGNVFNKRRLLYWYPRVGT